MQDLAPVHRKSVAGPDFGEKAFKVTSEISNVSGLWLFSVSIVNHLHW